MGHGDVLRIWWDMLGYGGKGNDGVRKDIKDAVDMLRYGGIC